MRKPDSQVVLRITAAAATLPVRGCACHTNAGGGGAGRAAEAAAVASSAARARGAAPSTWRRRGGGASGARAGDAPWSGLTWSPQRCVLVSRGDPTSEGRALAAV